MGLINLILGILLIILSIVGVVLKPFTYWWVVSIITVLIAIVLIWSALKPTGGPI